MTVPRSRWTAAALALAGLALAAAGMTVAGPWHDEESSAGPVLGSGATRQPADAATAAPALPQPGRGRPTRIEIPAIGVSAQVLPIVAVGGVLTPPDDVRLVGWWEAGAEPGEGRGTVLMAGHTYSRGDGVFDHLGELVPGARVRVLTQHGAVRYRVESVAAYPREQIVELAPRLFASTAGPQLVLTTCSGYDGEHYRMTTVVRALPTR